MEPVAKQLAYPPLAAALAPYVQILGFLAEVALMLWLIVRSVDVQRRRQQASAPE